MLEQGPIAFRSELAPEVRSDDLSELVRNHIHVDVVLAPDREQ